MKRIRTIAFTLAVLVAAASPALAQNRVEVSGFFGWTFSDGVSEAMNSADEEWGEEQLFAEARRCTSLAPEAAIRRLMAAADAFVAGAEQHDDMTLVIARVR